MLFLGSGSAPNFRRRPDFAVTAENIRALIHPDDFAVLDKHGTTGDNDDPFQIEYRVRRPNGDIRWCLSSAAATRDGDGVVRVSGVTIDITERKAAEERQTLLSREVDHRAKNALALVQSIVRLTKRADPADDAPRLRGGSTRSHACTRSCLSRAGRGLTLAGFARGTGTLPFG